MSKIIAMVIMSLVMTVQAKQVQLSVEMGKPVLLGEKKQTTYLKVGLTGFTLKSNEKRAPVNIGIVLDRSGSMSGNKLKQAKQAAIQVLDWLNNDDIVSIVVYDSTVSVLVPATKVSDKAMIVSAIHKIKSGGSTALFAGVSKGAKEVRKFFNRNNVNRVILLSDGQANVGPQKVSDLAGLGSALIDEGISVTTIGLGLGYNEDLMSQLANNSDGNHTFVEKADDLVKIFEQEFGDVLSVVAQEVSITIVCKEGIRPVRMLGRDAEIQGQKVTTTLSQLYSKQEKYLLLEIEVVASKAGTKREVADVSVQYANLTTHSTDKLSSSVEVSFSQSSEHVQQSSNTRVLSSAVQQIANIKSEEAVTLRDLGKVLEAKKVLRQNAIYLKSKAKELNEPSLEVMADATEEDADAIDSHQWNKRRKMMRKEQYKTKTQQSY